MIKKAVFPNAGLGTRFLPATKAPAKEMLSSCQKKRFMTFLVIGAAGFIGIDFVHTWLSSPGEILVNF